MSAEPIISFASPQWGAEKRRAAVSLTFDNLGEAADLAAGRWSQNVPLGSHPSVTRVLPKILKLLKEVDLKATFFVEAINTEMYPTALESIIEAGHELGFHGWRHEKWSKLTPAQESQLFQRGLAALEKLGVQPKGFRPPGGLLTPATAALLKKFNFTYCSPAGYAPGVVDGLAFLPFEWRLIDAYFYHAPFKLLRERYGDTAEPLLPTQLQAVLQTALTNAVQSGTYLALLFHPGMEDDDTRFGVMQDLLFTLKKWVDQQQVWCAPAYQVAEWMLKQPTSFSSSVVLDFNP